MTTTSLSGQKLWDIAQWNQWENTQAFPIFLSVGFEFSFNLYEKNVGVYPINYKKRYQN